MDIITDKIYMNKVKSKNTYQLTMENDFIVSDTKSDIDKIIREQGEVIIDEYKMIDGKINVKGKLRFDVLYLTNGENGILDGITEIIPFGEVINTSESILEASLDIKCELDDLSINVINSRKISARGLISLHLIEEEVFEQKIITDIQNEAEVIKEQISFMQLISNKKDIFRINENIHLQTSKDNIQNILYYDVKIINCNTRAIEEKLSIKGDLIVFVLYSTEDGEYECLEKEIPYAGELDLYEAQENMIDDVNINIGNKEVMVKQDEDGENRLIDVDVSLDLNVKLYKECNINLVKDAYGIHKCLIPKREEVDYTKLLLKNNTIFKINERLELKEKNKNIMQICNSTATLKIDSAEIVDNGISIEGVAEVCILYISNNDKEPICSFKELLPFNHLIEAKNITIDCLYEIKPYVEQISASMLARDEIEIRIGICLDTLIFNKLKENLILEIEEREFTKSEKEKMCTMVGYRVKEKDTLWSIAKKYNTTVDMLKEINKIVDKDIKTGDKLLIVREFVA
jgi:hypothetical protein